MVGEPNSWEELKISQILADIILWVAETTAMTSKASHAVSHDAKADMQIHCTLLAGHMLHRAFASSFTAILMREH